MGGDRITIPPRTGDSGPIGHGASPPVAAAPGAGRTIPTAWMRALLILSLLVLAVAAGLYFQSRPVPDSGVLRVSGNIEITDAEVSFKIAGRVVERSASEGESVKAGQSVARLGNSELAQEGGPRRAGGRAAGGSRAAVVAGDRPGGTRTAGRVGREKKGGERGEGSGGVERRKGGGRRVG